MRPWILLGLLAACLLLLPPTGAEANHLVTGAGSTVKALWVDDTTVYAALAHGEVIAIDRHTDTIRTDWGAQEYPDALPWDMTADGQRLYVAYSDEDWTNGQAAPIVAFDISTGAPVWSTQTSYPAAGIPHFDRDAYSLALHDGHLFAGLQRGSIVKLDADTGRPVLDPLGNPVRHDPADGEEDVVFYSPCPQRGQPSAVFAIDIHDGELWAARNFGGDDKQRQCHDTLTTSLRNVVYWLDPDTLQGSTTIRLPAFDAIDPPGTPDRRFAAPAIRDIWIDRHSPGSVYLAGMAAGDAGVFMRLQVDDPCRCDAGVQAADVVLTHDSDDFDGGLDDVILELGPHAMGRSIMGDADAVYALTWMNDTTSLPNIVPATGWALKFDRGLDIETGPGSWATTDGDQIVSPGRTLEAGDGVALFVEPEGNVIVGHGEHAPPFPSIGPVQHPAGALITELPKDDAPVVVLMHPNGNEALPTEYPVAFRVDMPVTDPRTQLQAHLEYTTDPGWSPDAAWTRLATYALNGVPANGYVATNNVAFDDLPDADGYRFRLTVAEKSGARTALDLSDGKSLVDKTHPTIDAVAPVHQDVLTTCQPLIEVDVTETLSDIDTFAPTGIFIDDVGYPYLSFLRNEAGLVHRIRLDMGQLDPQQGTPLNPRVGDPPGCLSDGVHIIEAHVYDRAGNFAFKRWSVFVDTRIQEPAVAPASGSWVRAAEPRVSMQFFEDVDVVSAQFGAVPAAFEVVPPHPVQNPQGTRLELRPTEPLEHGHSYDVRVTVRDPAGNVQGPFVSRLNVDLLPPEVHSPAPTDGALIADARPEIAFVIDDGAGSGELRSTLRVHLDGFDATRLVEAREGVLSFRPGAELAPGPHTVRVQVMDLAGHAADHEWSFRIDRNAPLVHVDVQLPDEQKAVKRGDVVIVGVLVREDSDVQSVVADVRGLDASLGPAHPLQRVTGTDGRFEARIVVAEQRSGPVEVKVAVRDAGDNEGRDGVGLLLDNVAPSSFMKELPPSAGATIQLAWQNSPDERAIGGSGVAYYIVERQTDDGPWHVLRPRVEATELTVGYAEATPSMQRFRVTAVDHAGNVQKNPSNAVETRAQGDPFEESLFPREFARGTTLSLTAMPRIGLDLEGAQAKASLSNGTGVVDEVDLQRLGRVFSGSIAPDLPPGLYVLRFHFIDPAGVESVGSSHLVQVLEPVQGVDEAARVGESAPGAAGGGGLLALLAAAGCGLRRRARS